MTVQRRMRMVLAGGLGTLVVACSGPPAAALSSDTNPSGECKWSSSAADWQRLITTPTEFAVDNIQVAGDQPVSIDSVELVNPTGITLTNVTFVKGGGVGEGGTFGDAALAPNAQAWASRVNLPGATLPPTGGAAAPDEWQAFIGLLPKSPDGGSSTGIQLTYRVGGNVFHLHGKMSVAVTRTESGCPQS